MVSFLNVNSLPYCGHEYRTKGNATKVVSTVHPDDINEKFNFLGSRYQVEKFLRMKRFSFSFPIRWLFPSDNSLVPFFTFSLRIFISPLQIKETFRRLRIFEARERQLFRSENESLITGRAKKKRESKFKENENERELSVENCRRQISI